MTFTPHLILSFGTVDNNLHSDLGNFPIEDIPILKE